MIEAALQLEVAEYIEKLQAERDERGRALVVRNGKTRGRKVTLGAGTIALRAPRVNDRRPQCRFGSKILLPYMRRSPAIGEALPSLYLRELSTGDFSEGLAALVGPEGGPLSSATITRLLSVWQEEYQAWRRRSLVGKDYVYIWADGLHFQVRLEEDRLACLVIMSVQVDGTKEVISVEDGYRESEESWASLLRDLQRRGMPAPMANIGDGALGFWAALRGVYPEAREQRCWVHKIRNVLDKLPKRLQARAKRMLQEIMEAPDREGAGSRKAGLALAIKLALAAESHWRKVNTPHLVALVRAGVQFKDGVQIPSHVDQQEQQSVDELPQRIAA